MSDSKRLSGLKNEAQKGARRTLAMGLFLLGVVACEKNTGGGTPVTDEPSPSGGPTSVKTPVRAKPGVNAPDPDALAAIDPKSVPPGRRALQVVHGQERIVDTEAALARGLTVVDLSDAWAPTLFDIRQDENGNPVVSRYRSVFIGLATDRTDQDGRPLAPGQKNFLELFGIPPSVSVVGARFLEDQARDCSSIDAEQIRGATYIPSYGSSTARERATENDRRRRRLDAAAQKAGVATWEELALKETRYARDVRQVRSDEAVDVALVQVEKRMLCEGRVDPKDHQEGYYPALRRAVVEFQEENALLDRADMRKATLELMTHPIQQNNLASLRRVLAERVVQAGGIIEDGSANDRKGKAPRYRAMNGEDRDVPNLVEEATDAVLARLGIATPEDALAFFKRHPAGDFESLKVVVRFPELPDYYGPNMDLVAEIDRGDIWYEVPYAKDGSNLPQPRRVLPLLTLFVRSRGMKVPLARWRTTIGGWRTEMASDGHTYLRYKGSDVGEKVWRHIVAAPVWIPPESTPMNGLLHKGYVNGVNQTVTNYEQVGPGYTSVYGLGMAIHVERRHHSDGTVTYFDNGIRTHGSHDYRSLLGRFSHGCHRMYNNLAVRLLGFVLKHREHRVVGSVQIDFRRRFLSDDRVFDIRLPVRGFYYELTPPLPIEVLEGNVKGELKKPVEEYVFKPGVEYPSDRPPPVLDAMQSRAGGEGADEGDS